MSNTWRNSEKLTVSELLKGRCITHLHPDLLQRHLADSTTLPRHFRLRTNPKHCDGASHLTSPKPIAFELLVPSIEETTANYKSFSLSKKSTLLGVFLLVPPSRIFLLLHSLFSILPLPHPRRPPRLLRWSAPSAGAHRTTSAPPRPTCAGTSPPPRPGGSGPPRGAWSSGGRPRAGCPHRS